MTAFQCRQLIQRSSALEFDNVKNFDVKSFLLTRAGFPSKGVIYYTKITSSYERIVVGIYPILWLALLLYAPEWWLETTVKTPAPFWYTTYYNHLRPLPRPPSIIATCSVLYVTGFNTTFFNDECNYCGRNSSLSLLCSSFLSFIFFSYFFSFPTFLFSFGSL